MIILESKTEGNNYLHVFLSFQYAYDVADDPVLVHVHHLEDGLEILLGDLSVELLLHPCPAQGYHLVHDFLEEEKKHETKCLRKHLSAERRSEQFYISTVNPSFFEV
jgi:hypothetical protein